MEEFKISKRIPTKEETFLLYQKQLKLAIEFSQMLHRTIVPWRFETIPNENNYSLPFYLEYIQPVLGYDAWYACSVAGNSVMYKWKPGRPCSGQCTVLFWLYPKDTSVEFITADTGITAVDVDAHFY